MWPWGHLAVGYLGYVAWVRLQSTDQDPLAIVAVAVGTQFPDLIDKPFAWTIPVLPSGRSLAHSALTASLVLLAVHRVSQRFNQQKTAVAFAIGYLTHIFGDLGPDTILGLLAGDLSHLQWTTYLLWPLLPAPPYPNDSSLREHLLAFSLDSFVATQLALTGIAALIWLSTGQPGLNRVRALTKQLIHSKK